jgi:hypothetical protein
MNVGPCHHGMARPQVVGPCHHGMARPQVVGPCHNGMARPQVADGGTPPIWRVAVNKLNKQPRTADEGWSSSLAFGRSANNPFP